MDNDIADTEGASAPSPLDLLSTSQTIDRILSKGQVSNDARTDLQIQREAVAAVRPEACRNGAPFIFFVDSTGRARVTQGCCNSWLCERCGHIRALLEYGRIVNGANELAGRGVKLYFLTMTCRGKELSVQAAEAGYLQWTNRLFTNLRTKANRHGGLWYYAAVTERQKRQHPHTHAVCSFCPDDARSYIKGQRLPNGRKAKHDLLWSEWYRAANVSAGLGPECDLSVCKNPVAVAVYQAKYMFKDAMLTEWPKGWRRVRYSRNWPKLPERHPEIAFPLLKLRDWQRMEALGMTVYADSAATLEAAYRRHVTCVRYTGKNDDETY